MGKRVEVVFLELLKIGTERPFRNASFEFVLSLPVCVEIVARCPNNVAMLMRLDNRTSQATLMPRIRLEP